MQTSKKYNVSFYPPDKTMSVYIAEYCAHWYLTTFFCICNILTKFIRSLKIFKNLPNFTCSTSEHDTNKLNLESYASVLSYKSMCNAYINILDKYMKET